MAIDGDGFFSISSHPSNGVFPSPPAINKDSFANRADPFLKALVEYVDIINEMANIDED